MSEKQATYRVMGEREDGTELVAIAVTVDFINPGNTYVNIGIDDAIVVPDADARRLAEFILKETRA